MNIFESSKIILTIISKINNKIFNKTYENIQLIRYQCDVIQSTNQELHFIKTLRIPVFNFAKSYFYTDDFKNVKNIIKCLSKLNDKLNTTIIVSEYMLKNFCLKICLKGIPEKTEFFLSR